MSGKKNNEVDMPLNWKRELFEWLKIIVIAAVIAFFINTFLIANSRVPSGSMETTIMTGDRLIGSRLAYRFGGEPQRGDVVIFDHETGPGNEEIHLVKRIIGLPGETVDIRDNHVYINQSQTPLEEPYLKEPMESEDYQFNVPAGCYLMLGDNRNNSADARYWKDPYVSEDKILAKVLIRYYPGIKKIS
ncbi:MAG: lepB [Lacrimispora sp.]|jgi:signal peptidase I|nr:lepB [Lacrimispora sp.]